MVHNACAKEAAELAGKQADDVAGEAAQASRKVLALPAPDTTALHHIIPVFRGKSAKYAEFIQARGIMVDQYCVRVAHGNASHHLKFIHGSGKWNQKWMDWIDANPGATAKDIFQQAGRMMDEFGLSGSQIVPYR
ncbi:MAG TPA: hypothetical protein DD670_19725 [Planctomycetaceae bacterium]|nr:hypothetical protein [Planctomycetaceae bacterium]